MVSGLNELFDAEKISDDENFVQTFFEAEETGTDSESSGASYKLFYSGDESSDRDEDIDESDAIKMKIFS